MIKSWISGQGPTSRLPTPQPRNSVEPLSKFDNQNTSCFASQIYVLLCEYAHR